ncbi:prolyl oligopeptidase family serine peptidase [Shewanella polaris]|uniref:S9 family peptidase n=1 Tax=Shewanella polaris TaxID=2588449 RepID=A0A4Y5YCT9_9GAMM|nr:prolyl oligopeptidase family serine peptidase [Shewanella polaris]QDE30562.1 S9 family peptidase [Shewanella polaris]
MKLFNLIPLAICLSFSAHAAPERALSLDDIMHFETLQQPVISDNGKVIAVQATPDRGDSRALIRFSDNRKQYEIINGTDVNVSADGKFVLATIEATLFDRETKKKDDLPHQIVLLNTENGKQQQFDKVNSASFSDDGHFLVVKFEANKPEPAESELANTESKIPEPTTSEPIALKSTASETKNTNNAKADSEPPEIEKADKGADIRLINLATEQQTQLSDVTRFVFDKAGNYFVAAVNQGESKLHQVVLITLDNQTQRQLYTSTDEHIEALAISDDGQYVAVTKGAASAIRYGREYNMLLIDVQQNKQQQFAQSEGWTYNQYSSLQFSKDGQRLFVGRVPKVEQQAELADYQNPNDVFNPEIITAKKQLRIWHGDDAKIKPQEVKEYEQELKRTYLAVLHLDSNTLVQLADQMVPDVTYGEQTRFLLASSDVPYQKMITWAGFYRDVYLVDVSNGNKIPVLTQQPSGEMPTLSPQAKYLAYYQQGNVYLYDVASQRKINLTANISTPFANEDHDYPSEAPGYGFGPWLADGSAITVYDKYDVWQFNSASKQGFMLTNGEGRKQKTQFRIVGLVQDKPLPAVVNNAETVLLQGYNHLSKADGFFSVKIGVAGVNRLTESNSKLTLLARADKAATVVFSKQRYDLYPDLYIADNTSPQKAVQLTTLDKQRKPFKWGNAELVHWRDGDGIKMDGVLIKPANYQAGKQYPTLVYFYRFMSDRLHAFPDMKLNHRPNFAWYADNGYAIFLPDIRFEIGYPGISSVKALTAGVQKLIEMGVSDPNAIGIQGHSWAGYQSAYAVTQTNIFKAVVTGAPVSNMTSAYSGIRHGSGLARQFQYETGQSRIGESLFKAPQKYIENSPIFYVDRIQTPMMIMFGDKDDAVPWEQGVELYLAMRRAGKDVVFLQYEDEPHHLKKYPNKLDYSIKMKQYFDHYLKGAPAPDWLRQGEAYREYKTAD